MKPILTIQTSKIEESESRICSGTIEELEKYKTKKQELLNYTKSKLNYTKSKLNGKKLLECVNKCDQGANIRTQNSEICDYKNDKTKLLKISKNNILKVIQSTDYATIDCKQGIKQINDIINENNNNIKYSELIHIFPLHILSSNHLEECLTNPIVKTDLESESIASIAKTDENIDIFSQKITNIYTMEKITGVTLDTFIQNMTDENELDYIIIQLFYILLYANINGYYHNDLKANNIIIYYNNIHEIIYDQLFDYKITIGSKIASGKSSSSSLQQSTSGFPIVKLIDFFSSTFINPTSDLLAQYLHSKRQKEVDSVSFIEHKELLEQANIVPKELSSSNMQKETERVSFIEHKELLEQANIVSKKLSSSSIQKEAAQVDDKPRYYIIDLISILSNIENILVIKSNKHKLLLDLFKILNRENLNELYKFNPIPSSPIPSSPILIPTLSSSLVGERSWYSIREQFRLLLEEDILDKSYHFTKDGIDQIFLSLNNALKDNTKIIFETTESNKKKEDKKKYLKYKQKYLQLKNQLT